MAKELDGKSWQMLRTEKLDKNKVRRAKDRFVPIGEPNTKQITQAEPNPQEVSDALADIPF
jgi:hypothetical protein